MRRRCVYWIIVASTYIFSVYSMLVVFFVLTFPRLRHNRELESIDAIKYLDVHVACSLSWNDPLKYVTSKVSKGMGMLKQAIYYLPKPVQKPSIRI